jgi:hypothetical protein
MAKLCSTYASSNLCCGGSTGTSSVWSPALEERVTAIPSTPRVLFAVSDSVPSSRDGLRMLVHPLPDGLQRAADGTKYCTGSCFPEHRGEETLVKH